MRDLKCQSKSSNRSSTTSNAVDALLKQIPGYIGKADGAREKILDMVKKKDEEQRSVS